MRVGHRFVTQQTLQDVTQDSGIGVLFGARRDSFSSLPDLTGVVAGLLRLVRRA